jgi:tetratricopeptide (TPR) repeat protein
MLRGDLAGAARVVKEELENTDYSVPENKTWWLRFIWAQVLSMRGDPEAALLYLESFRPPGNSELDARIELARYCGTYAGSLGRYETSHRLLVEAETMARVAGMLNLVGECLLSRAFLFFLQKAYASSDRLFREVLNLAEQLEGCYFRGHAMWGIGKNLMIQEHHQEAMPWLEDSLRNFEGAGARLEIAMVWSEMAVCHLGMGDDEKAMELLREAEKVNRDAGFIHNYQVVLANIGNVYLHRGDQFTAILYYRRALDLARQIKDPVSIRKWTRNINLAYARIRLIVDRQNPRIA